MPLNSNERQLLAEFFGLTVISLDADGPLEEKSFVKAVELVFDGLYRSVSFLNVVSQGSFAGLPHLKHRVLEQSHVSR